MSEDTQAVIEDTVPKGEFTEDELAGLSDEERAALIDDDDTEVKTDLDDDLAEELDTKSKKNEETSSEDSEEVRADDGDAEKAQSSDAESVEEGQEPEEASQEPQEHIQQRQVGDISALDARDAELKAKLEELDNQVADGEIDLSVHIKETRSIMDERQQIALEKSKQSIYAEENQREFNSRWDRAINDFYADESNKQFDVAENGGNDVIYNALNSTVQDLQQKAPGKAPSWYLSEGKKLVSEAFGITNEAKPEVKKRRKSALDADIPNTLSGVPAAAANSVGGEFDHLEKLTGIELEEAVSRMSPAQQEKWVRA